MNPTSFPLLFHNRPFLTATWIIFTCIILACEKDQEPLSTNSVINGVVSFYYMDEDHPYSQVKIVANGPYGSKSAVPGEDGRFTIEGLENGTYYLTYSCPGYGTEIIYNIKCFGNDTSYCYGSLYKIPVNPTVPDLVSAIFGAVPGINYPDNKLLVKTSWVNSYPSSLPLMLFFKAGSEASWDHYDMNYPAMNVAADQNGHMIVIIQPEILPFKHGEKISIKGYPYNIYEGQKINPYTGNYSFSTLVSTKPTNSITCTMP